jgi:tRNA-guanine family transglycosylase
MNIEEQEEFRFWDSSPYLRYDCALISAYYGMKKQNYRKYYNFPEGFTLWADSGAIQFFRSGHSMDVEKILAWDEKNVDFAISCDFIPEESLFNRVIKEEKFEHGIKISKKNYEIMAGKRKNFNMKLMSVIHGDTSERLDRWFRETTEGLEFDGLCMSPSFLEINQFMNQMRWMLEKTKEYKYFHILGGGNMKFLPIILYFANKVQNLTFDIASPFISGRQYATYYLPFSAMKIRIGDKTTDRKFNNLCICPVCRKHSIEELKRAGGYGHKNEGNLIGFHNLFWFLVKCKFLKNLAKDKEVYFSYLNSLKGGKEVVKCIEQLEKKENCDKRQKRLEEW